MSDSFIQCKTEIPKVEKLKDNELTVGRHFYLVCNGSWDKSFDFSKAQLKLDEKSKNIFKLFKAEARDLESFEIDMTVYAAGEIKFESLVLTDTHLDIQLGSQTFKVESVLSNTQANETQDQKSSQQPPQPPKPFGYAAGQLQWPFIYYVIMAFIFVFLLIKIIRSFLLKQKLKKLQKSVEFYNSALAADQQFYKTLRQLEKKSYPIHELEKAAQIYILRKFQVPVFDLNLKSLEKVMKKKLPRNKTGIQILINLLKDISALKNSIDQKNTLEQEIYEKKIKFINQFYEFISVCEQSSSLRAHR